MQWSQIKTLFILCFLLLDVYLLFQFVQKQEDDDHDVLRKEVESIEDNLKAEGITYPADLPDGEIKGTYIKVQQQPFTDEEISTVKAIKNQETAVIDKQLIISKLKKPVSIKKGASEEEIAALVKSKLKLISPESYVLWDWNKDLNVLTLFQEKNKRPIYFNQNAMILVFLNGKNEITSYTQTLLGEEESQQSKEVLAKPIEEINILYQKNELYAGEEVTSADIGYHTRIPVENGTQIFAPTWKITVDNERTYFVNAIEGLINKSEEIEFLKKSISTIIGKVNKMEDNPDLKEEFLSLLAKRINAINAINRGETE